MNFHLDLSYAWRGLVSNPTWTAVAVLSLALGIGVNTVVFSIVEGVVLRPFPYEDPERVVLMWGSSDLQGGLGISAADLEDWRSQTTTLEALAPYGDGTVAIRTEAAIPASWIAHDMFRLLGTSPFIGGGFLPEHDAPESPRAVIVTYGFWQSRLSGDIEAVGRTLEIGESLTSQQPYEIVGIMPKGFFFPDYDVQVLINLGALGPGIRDRESTTLRAAGRLKEGTTIEAVQAELHAIRDRLDAAYPLIRKRDAGVFHLNAVVLRHYDQILWMLLAAVQLVLLMACCNVTNLMLARGVARQKEMAVRSALGASRSAIMRHLLIESLLVSFIAGTISLLIAYWGIQFVLDLGLVDAPRIENVQMNWKVLLFALIASLLSGVGSGLMPALRASRTDLRSMLNAGNPATSGPPKGFLRSGLVVSEIAVAVVLLTATGLLVRSSVELGRLGWGFDPENLTVITAQYSAALESGPARRRIEFADAAIRAISGVPDVVSVTSAINAPLFMQTLRVSYAAPVTSSPAVPDMARIWIVTRDYFKTLGVRVTGREFQESDTAEAARTVVLSKSLAARFFPGEDPIGKQIQLQNFRYTRDEISRVAEAQIQSLLQEPDSFVGREDMPRVVIGVADDVRMLRSLTVVDYPAMYIDYRQVPQAPPIDEGPTASQQDRLANYLGGARMSPNHFIVRTQDGSRATIESVVNRLQSVDPEVAFDQIVRMEDRISRVIGGAGAGRLMLVLSIAFGTLALALAASGTYGMLSHTVSIRTHEIGIRMAMGASQPGIMSFVLLHVLRIAGLGIGFGLGAAWIATRALTRVLFRVAPTDLVTFGSVGLLLLVVAICAGLLPALRAARTNPLTVIQAHR